MRVSQIIFQFFKFAAKLCLILAVFWVVFQYAVLHVTVITDRDFFRTNEGNTTVSLVTNLDVIKILIWSKDDTDFKNLQTGQEAFIKNKCDKINCYVTRDRKLLGEDYSLFDVILINAKDIGDLPTKRLAHQKYIFATRDLPTHRPICDKVFDRYFNLTFTTKLHSDAVWSLFPIVTQNDEIKNEKSIKNKYVTSMLNDTKLYTAVYFKQNCSSNDSSTPISDIVRELRTFYLDVRIACAEECYETKNCSEDLDKFYFYFVVEYKTDTDLVVNETLRAIHHNTVPVILSPTDYTKYLPPDSFINAWKLGPRNTAIKMAKLIVNETGYMRYFNWRRSVLYRPNRSSECKLCELLNEKGTKTYHGFRNWWNPAKSRCVKY